MTQVFRLAALVLLIGIVFATLAPIGLRPETGHVSAERILAFAALGLTAALGFPRHLWTVLVAMVVLAVGLELLQLVDPTRHGRALDAFVKAVGGVAGTMAGYFLSSMTARARSRSR
jgi:VanZ family protein